MTSKSLDVNGPLHVPTPCPSPSQSPSKFNIVLTGRNGSIGTILNFDGECNGDGHGVGTCRQTLQTDALFTRTDTELILNSAL